MNISSNARGKWRGILMALKVDDRFLKPAHGPCPFCEGKDRFRFDDKDGRGTFICSQCGAGDGFEFLKRYYGWDFKAAASEIEKIVGGITRMESPKSDMTDQKQRDMIRRVWDESLPLTGDDPASIYLQGRGVLPGRLPVCLRFHPKCVVPNGGTLPAMIAMVQDKAGRASTIHRTFLGPNGKAEIETPRALLPGGIADGSAVRLYPVHGERLGIAEGIETAIAAAKRFQLPVWSALNSALLKKWIPPLGVTHVTIFGDNDKAFGGQSAAYELAHRLVTRNRMEVTVNIPQTVGKDWADAGVA